ncbi:MAG: hypothetical protein ACI8UO_005046 [Verrucomicrobiales bacterium]|jgi:hypothetical protein
MAIQRESSVTYSKWPELRLAINAMISNGAYKRLADIHADMVQDPDGFAHAKHRMHGATYGPIGLRRFLPWHRAYLIMFERELRKIDSTLSLPYWDWHNDGGRLVGFTGILGLSSGRDLGTLPGQTPVSGRQEWFVDANTFDSFTQYTGEYYPFSRALESGPHGAGHNWIGGDMANTMISPNDFVFWLHHAQVDRYWAKWQENNPGEMAWLSGREARLDPWSSKFNIQNINDVSNLGADSYEYVDP